MAFSGGFRRDWAVLKRVHRLREGALLGRPLQRRTGAFGGSRRVDIGVIEFRVAQARELIRKRKLAGARG